MFVYLRYLINNSGFSGGKDSTYNMMECVRNGHELVALANLHPKQDIGKNNFYTIMIIFFFLV